MKSMYGELVGSFCQGSLLVLLVLFSIVRLSRSGVVQMLFRKSMLVLLRLLFFRGLTRSADSQLRCRSSLLALLTLCLVSGLSSSTVAQLQPLPGAYFSRGVLEHITKKSADINRLISKGTNKYIKAVLKEESRLRRRLKAGEDTTVLRDILSSKYSGDNLPVNASTLKRRKACEYLPHLDSLQTMLLFLSESGVEQKASVSAAIKDLKMLQEQINQAGQISRVLDERKELLEKQLSKFGLTRELKRLKKQVYYYQKEVEAWKDLLSTPSKLERLSLDLLSKNAAFRDFFASHSRLSGLFKLPGLPGEGEIKSVEGLQTRQQVRGEMVKRFGRQVDLDQELKGSTASHLSAASAIGAVRQQARSLSTQDKSLPDFKPNSQKTKRLLQRLEFGSNLQTVKANYFFPATTDMGLSIGYRLNDRSLAGIGGSYKMGWGKDIRHIRISHQGVGLRTFVDYKLKGNIWLSGGGELNYRSAFHDFKVLEDLSAWQRSALVGVSKRYRVSNKLNGEVKLLYDFLWREQVPRTQPVIFRVGYQLR